MGEQQWTTDVLGAPFEQHTLDLGTDDEGPVVATLVRLLPAPKVPPPRPWYRRWFTWPPPPSPAAPLADVDVLYVHGWSDYFFQKRLAKFWTSRGARFFALDLRKYGRSLRDGQTPGYIADLTTYDEDIAAALGAMGWSADKAHPERRLVMFGHSTGGLTLSNWVSRHPGIASALVLNSPWLALQLSAFTRAAVTPLISWSARLAPMDVGPQLDLGFYTRAQQEAADPDDPMDIDLHWRPEKTMPVHTGWLHAIVTAQNRLETDGYDISVPVCVMLSARSTVPTKWTEALTTSDSVLVVDDIAKQALKLGSSVGVERIDGALHDVFLSRPEPRAEAYRRLATFARSLTYR